jgi:flagellar protein FliS
VNSTSQGIGQYQSVGNYAAVSAADKLRLVQLMMQGAQDRIARAKGHLMRGEISGKGEQIGRAIQLIDGLRASLDRTEGADIAANLDRLYDYMMRRLLQANLQDDAAGLDEVSSLLGEVKGAWEDVVRQSQDVLAGKSAQ